MPVVVVVVIVVVVVVVIIIIKKQTKWQILNNEELLDLCREPNINSEIIKGML
jgi:septation ring formation regulator EzrA